jgi:hypothetical protein
LNGARAGSQNGGMADEIVDGSPRPTP